jgi:hypothetical protein
MKAVSGEVFCCYGMPYANCKRRTRNRRDQAGESGLWGGSKKTKRRKRAVRVFSKF